VREPCLDRSNFVNERALTKTRRSWKINFSERPVCADNHEA
jgi:hypothetical protein